MTTRQRRLYLTTDEGKTCEIDVVADASNPASKRLPAIRDQETRLQKELFHLEDSTRAKNKQFEEQLDELGRQAAAWREKLNRECSEAKTSIEHLQEQCDIAAKEVLQSLDDYLHEKFSVVPQQLIPPRHQQLDSMAQDTSDFFQHQVPQLVESQTGVVTRRLMKANETFDIEKQKDERRETKIVQRANSHIQRTAQRMLDDSTVTLAKQMLLKESIVEAERSAARMLEIRTTKAVQTVVDLRDKIRAEAAEREREDQVVLSTVLETQEKLQKTVLEHFGRQQPQPDDEDAEQTNVATADDRHDAEGDENSTDSARQS